MHTLLKNLYQTVILFLLIATVSSCKTITRERWDSSTQSSNSQSELVPNYIPVGKASVQQFKEAYATRIKISLKELQKELEKESPSLSKVSNKRKIFILLRHFSELYRASKELPPSESSRTIALGKLPYDLETVAKRTGKYVDAMKSKKKKVAAEQMKKALKAIKKLRKLNVKELIRNWQIVSSTVIKIRVNETKALIKESMARTNLHYKSFHDDVKKAVRMLISITNFRLSYENQSKFASRNEENQVLYRLLGAVSDQIAADRLELSPKELEEKIYVVTDEMKEKAKQFLPTVQFSDR